MCWKTHQSLIISRLHLYNAGDLQAKLGSSSERNIHLAQESETQGADVMGAGVPGSLATAPSQAGEPAGQHQSA